MNIVGSEPSEAADNARSTPDRSITHEDQNIPPNNRTFSLNLSLNNLQPDQELPKPSLKPVMSPRQLGISPWSGPLDQGVTLRSGKCLPNPFGKKDASFESSGGLTKNNSHSSIRITKKQ
jgi:hypothetical protein